MKQPTAQERNRWSVEKSSPGLGRSRETEPLEYLRKAKAGEETNSLLQQ